MPNKIGLIDLILFKNLILPVIAAVQRQTLVALWRDDTSEISININVKEHYCTEPQQRKRDGKKQPKNSL